MGAGGKCVQWDGLELMLKQCVASWDKALTIVSYCHLIGSTRLIINPFLLTTAQPVLSDVYGGETAPARFNNVMCNGNEDQLFACPLVPLTGSDSCAAYMGPAGVVCRGQRMKLLVMKV